jgi:hypothetical protein
MFDAGDVRDIFRFTVIQVEFLDFIENFLRPVAFLIVFHRYVGKRAKHISLAIFGWNNEHKILAIKRRQRH